MTPDPDVMREIAALVRWETERYPEASPDLHCPACHRRFAVASVRAVSVDFLVEEEEPEYEDGPVSEPPLAEASVNVQTGLRITLEPGYVAAPRRHSSGNRWYRPGRSTASPSPHVRLPAVVTCRCGYEMLVPGIDRYTSELARAGEDGRREQLESQIDAARRAEYRESERIRRLPPLAELARRKAEEVRAREGGGQV